ncbi:hypothetical protein NP233_g10703 [Leucocoprinus birnbaumii]|uniref:Integrase catalytic domain-containing protein n=1 Tax=Leucocoprinus birnbaumii TaxID=56174 RepID=A0AAD5VHZ1_9AGAR|nr:hypothetical protein NP233_g10703 [Leucocoprinus birnbaumii]
MTTPVTCNTAQAQGIQVQNQPLPRIKQELSHIPPQPSEPPELSKGLSKSKSKSKSTLTDNFNAQDLIPNPTQFDLPPSILDSPQPMADNELCSGSNHEDECPGSDHDEDKGQAKPYIQLANALVALSSTLNHMDNCALTALPGRSKWVKVREPETFDSSNPKKLRNWKFLLKLYFDANRHQFTSKLAKVRFGITYLMGTALSWFQSHLDQVNLEETDLKIYNDFDAFVHKLESCFSHADPVMEAAEELENLKMTNNHHITKYNIKFTRLATLTGWNNTVLYHRYYKGLLDQIKDILATATKPATLSDLQETACKLNVRYWERQREKKRSKPSSLTPKSDSGDSNSKDKGKKKKKGSNNQQSNNSSNSSGSSSAKSNNNLSSEKKDYAKYLTPEGKLTDQEHNRRFQNKLCMICVSNKHMADSCPVKLSSGDCLKAKACQAQVADPPKADASTSLGPSSESFRLNASALSDPHALHLLTSSSYFSPNSPLVSSDNSVQALVDSGSTHCFVDSSLVNDLSLPTTSIALVELQLFDSTPNAYISQSVTLPISFESGESMSVDFYVTRLDSTCALVLGHNWLTRHNLLIDWALNSITFRPDLQERPTSPHAAQLALSDPISDLSDILSVTPPDPTTDLSADPSVDPVIVPSDHLHISLINASTFMCASRLPGSLAFTLDLNKTSMSAGSAKPSEPVNLSSVPSEYHDFADIFSKSKANELPPHCPYNLKINLKEGTSPPVGTIYSLLQVELQVLWEFIDENLAIGFIRPSTSPHGAPVLFVRKKDNLRHAYHLVHIAKGDKWKTAFQTWYAFQRFMNDIFNNLLDVCITIYLDDILIYLDDIALHKDHGTPWNFTNKHCESFKTLKKAFMCTPVLTHWIPDAQIVVKTDASYYALAAILSIIALDGDIHPVAFHSCTFNPAELNYDVHDKELLAIFKAFQIWQHYLEGLALPVDVVTNHKNLEYFSTTKVLTHRQACWSKYLAQFNPVIRFCPGQLGTRPDALTRQWDIYLKGGNNGYATVNPHNFRPVFTQEQLAASLQASALYFPTLCAGVVIDYDLLHKDILAALPSDPIASQHLSSPQGCWSVDSDGFLRLDDCIYVPDSNNLPLRVLQYKHDHMLSDTTDRTGLLILSGKSILGPKCIHSSRTSARVVLPLLIPDHPWNSISMDFIKKLPPSTGFNTILVIVNCLTKQSLFIPTHDTITCTELTRLFILHVFSKHGVPLHITSDRRSEFVSHFFRSLGQVLEMKLHFTSGYHPEGNGQTEQMNQTLEQYL